MHASFHTYAYAQDRAEHGVYGYSVPLEEVTQEVVTYLERTAHYKVYAMYGWVIDACFIGVCI